MRSEITRVARKHGLDEAATMDIERVFASLLEQPAPPQSVLPTLATLSDIGFTSIQLGEPTEPQLPAPPRDPLDRYEDLGGIGEGAMGEVRRVRDRELNRTLAMKTMHAGLLERPRALARFVEEAQATSQLQHPNIVPVHDIGLHPDGRVWFTMKEVQGRTLTEVVREVHAASGDRWESAESGWTFRQVVSAFIQVCRAVAYANERGVVHRDLKPDNIMLGEHGEVYVVDWGLAKVVGRPDNTREDDTDAVSTGRALSDSMATRVGTVSGTPFYMSPEQARGAIDHIDARSDVYGLGAVLFEILSGEPHVSGEDLMAVLTAVATGDVRPLPALPRIPNELAAALRRAMAFAPADRFASAAAFADAVQAWQDGAHRRDQALGVVETALARESEAAALRGRAIELEAQSASMLEQVPSWAAEERKAPGWALQDEATALKRQADAAELAVEQELQAALRIDALNPEAHVALLERHTAEHAASEAHRNVEAVARAEARIETHLLALPVLHPARVATEVYLRGHGRLTLVTDPPGAEVVLHRYVLHNRRYIAEPIRVLGHTPLHEVTVEMGSYLCLLRHPDRAEVRYPVAIGRGEHWSTNAPGDAHPRPIVLPRAEALGPEDCYVPAGGFIAGGDPDQAASYARQRVWCPGFVIRRFPVTNTEYLAFLNDLVRQGRAEEALGFAPRERPGAHGEEGALSYGRSTDGRFALVADAEGDAWLPDYPALNVSWACARAYADWLAAQTGQAWRLPLELEWEKAARGVDGRWFPWGDFGDPSWACLRHSRDGRPLPAVVDSFPVDESVYGVRGLGGNVHDWCADPFLAEGPATHAGRVVVSAIDGGPAPQRRVVRGGIWVGFVRHARCAVRWGHEPTNRFANLGFRLVRPISG